ncbi:hypothetical protein [Bacillus sp. MRMR6]|jgi:hypothetical protein|uniref:hypothetical protein n=1 Tax=Bacillus sp. MRMR6 TaxID=1928617 RepID=UPI00095163D1|nr:hypothetical protein [Bacillus sp. MRMR6]OLS40522.1 hypothetical protein BTR25_08425 [Bacillus sp. MRMR6]
MKKYLTVFILLLFCGNSTTYAETIHFFRPKSVTFTGGSQNWDMVYRMYLKGTEVSYEFNIKYKGKDEKVKSKTFLLHQLDKKGVYEIGAWDFHLDQFNQYQSGVIKDCYGCQYWDKEKRVIFIINRWEEKPETVVLTNKTKK